MQNHMKEQERVYSAFWFKNSLTWCDIAIHNFDSFYLEMHQFLAIGCMCI